MTRPATMKDVAAAVGVSIKTVSRVVNGQADVHPLTRARIEAAMKELNFRPNAMASIIRRRDGRSASVGLVVEDLANPFMALLARAVQDDLLKRRHLVLIASSDGLPQREREIVAEFVIRRVDGLIVVPSGPDQSYLERERARGVPVVFVDRPGRRIEADAVLSDNSKGVRQAVQHLARHGHRRIGYIGDLSDFHTAGQRLEGYRQGTLAAAGHVDETYIRTDVHTGRDSERATRSLLDLPLPPTAVLCGNNVLTNGALRALEAAALRQRTAVIGFDDQELADLLTPGLSVIAQDVVTMGHLATERLFQRLGTQAGVPYEHLTVPVTLIRRGSGELPAEPDGRLPRP